MMWKSMLAALTPKNIKFIYLRRTLLKELSEDPHTFEEKVKGSYVRARTDPNDPSHGLSHQILQVTGARKSRSDGNIYLRVSNMPNRFYLDSLSDSDLKEEECMDFMQKVKHGLIQHPTLMQLQEKATSLHVDIVKHWIARELWLLGRQITQTREKGPRRELKMLLKREKELRDPSHQSQLLEAYPNVEAEKLEPIVEKDESVSGTPAVEMEQPVKGIIGHSFEDNRKRGKKARKIGEDDDIRRAKKRQYTGKNGGRERCRPRLPPRNPFFVFHVTQAALQYLYVYIRRAFLETHLSGEKKHHDVVLRLPGGGKYWSATISITASGGWIRGLRSFFKDNQLAPGNTCFFEWHEADKTFTVHIYS